MSLRWLVLGADGQVGRRLAHALAPLGPGEALSRAQCDLARPGDVMRAVSGRLPRVVVNAAAYTAVDQAEEEPELALRINAEAVAELAKACATHAAVLVHYSTDYVFDGQGSLPFGCDAVPAPLQVYGRTKLAGEQAIRQAGVRHLILRTSWVFDSTGHNFVATMLRLGAERESLRVVCDQVGAPTWAATIADVTAQLLQDWARSEFVAERGGTYHLCSHGETSWHGFAEAIFTEAASLGLLKAGRPRVEPILSCDYPQKAQRPLNSRLDLSRLETTFGLRLPHWRDALRQSLCQRARTKGPADT